MGNCFNFLYIISVTIPPCPFCFLNGNLVLIYLISIGCNGCYFLRKIEFKMQNYKK